MCFMISLGLLVIGAVGFVALLFCVFSIKAYHDTVEEGNQSYRRNNEL